MLYFLCISLALYSVSHLLKWYKVLYVAQHSTTTFQTIQSRSTKIPLYSLCTSLNTVQTKATFTSWNINLKSVNTMQCPSISYAMNALCNIHHSIFCLFACWKIIDNCCMKSLTLDIPRNLLWLHGWAYHSRQWIVISDKNRPECFAFSVSLNFPSFS